ncbi:uncharacterized protein LOC121876227 isoform X2 [Homarus americanus]|uniref:uncharacterized protein LOC121876227 isoform X2 n=1 Tax=Homarus americanus TaxID=6706 RepID=UPI001C468AA6|nr:uncharacterized protein LOC121876227 isoform X2 [Homarus americanus]
MLEVLVLGLVGLTYTCVHTLFFLNCLNSRRRERRRLEKVYRDSIRKIKGSVGDVRKSKKENEKEVHTKTSKENGICVQEENEKRVDDNNKNVIEESCEGHLVTRLVVKSGKETLPTSQEELTSSHCVRVQNAILQLNDQAVEDKHDLATAPDGPPSHHKNEVSLTIHDNSCSTLTVDATGPESPYGYTITVNSNMIEVREDGEPALQYTDPHYESLEGDPHSILTQVTTLCDDSDGRHESLQRTTDVFREVQETRLSIEDSCSAEDELDETYRKLSRLPGVRDDINLVTTISQILQSPPESMEPGSENQPMEVLTTIPGLTPTDTNATVIGQSHLPVGEAGECGDWRVTARCGDPLLKGDSTNHHGESCKRSDRDAVNRIWHPRSEAASGSHQGTWTLPRAGRRGPDAHGSLPRLHGRMCISRKEGKSAPGGHTLPRPAAGHSARRDEAREGGNLDQAHTLNTCHSRPAMAGAATTPPHTAHYTITNDDNNAGINNEILSSDNSGSITTAGDLEVISVHSEDHTDSEGSGDSLYFTASDHTNSDVNSYLRGDGDEAFEATIYETIETPNIQHIENSQSVTITLTASNQTDTASKHESDEHCDTDESASYAYDCNIYEEIKGDSELSSEQTSKECSESQEDADSVGSGSQYGNISESDTHADSGYESPVKADIHSSDETASTASSSSQDHHYEDIDPSLMARAANGEGRTRESSRRGRSLKETNRRESSRGAKDEGSGEAARHRQRLQGLDDLIAGVPPPDYDDRGAPLNNESARPDVGASGQQGSNIPPPPEFGDGSGRNVNGEASGRRQLHSTLSVPPLSSSGCFQHLARAPLSRTNSEPPPPPPPPMPAATPSPRTSPSTSHRSTEEVDNASPVSSKPSSPRSTHTPFEERDDDEGPSEEGVVRPSDFIRRSSQRSENGSMRGHKKVDRPVSLPLDDGDHYGKILTDGRDRDSLGSNEELSQSPHAGKAHLINGKTLPFIPPKFPTQPSSDSGLIKPSEYLRSLGGSISRSPSNGDSKSLHGSPHGSDSSSHSFDSPDNTINTSPHTSLPPGPLPAIPESTEEEPTKVMVNAPPPPPAPPAPPASSTNTMPSRNNTLNNNNNNNGSKTVLPTISVTDLQSVQLRKIETKVVKPTSGSLRMSLTPEPSFTTAKNDVIAELKMGVDIPGIKKLKSERAKEEEIHVKLEEKQINRQFSATNFVDQVPEVDNAGNRIPEWKRQMLARKAAEKAKKEAEEMRLQEAEEKRLQSIPPWKRQLMMRKDDDGSKRDHPITARTQSPVRIALHVKH